MTNLTKALKTIAARLNQPEALVIKAAIDRIEDLEERLAEYEEDITGWQLTVKKQMGRQEDNQ